MFYTATASSATYRERVDLQCVAVCCSVLHGVAVYCSVFSVMQCVLDC